MFEFYLGISQAKVQKIHHGNMLSKQLNALQQLRNDLGHIPEEIWYQAENRNPWFTRPFMEQAVQTLVDQYLDSNALLAFTRNIPEQHTQPKTIGVVMAGNIPLVGFHDLLCVYLSGHHGRFKLAEADTVLMRYVLDSLHRADANTITQLQVAERLNGCEAYIATGSNQSAGHFEYYFGKRPNIIRRNRTSVAILDGTETTAELEALAEDVYLYFGLGCRNVTHIAVPENYSFEPLLQAFRKYDALKDHNKYRNNFDYQLALYILNGQFYMSNESILLVENTAIFSPVSVLHYSYYSNAETQRKLWEENTDIQAVVGHFGLPFGSAQCPTIHQFADGVNTLDFLLHLK